MGVTISKSFPIAARALQFRDLRQKLIASNLANVDTPFYKARDISFERVLAKEAHALHRNEPTLRLAKTDPAHLEPLKDQEERKATFFIRGDLQTRNDGNSVDLDVETTEMSKNALMISALDAALKKQASIFKSVLEASSKIS